MSAEWVDFHFTCLARISGAFNLDRRSVAGIDYGSPTVNSRILRLSRHINLRVAMFWREIMKVVQEEAVCH